MTWDLKSSSLTSNIGAVLVQDWLLHFLHNEVQYNLRFLQLQVMVLYPSCMHSHDTMLSKMSGATGISVSIGTRVPSYDRHPHFVGGKLLSIHSWTVWYVQYKCCFAGALVGGELASWNNELKELQPMAHLYALCRNSSRDPTLLAPYSFRMGRQWPSGQHADVVIRRPAFKSRHCQLTIFSHCWVAEDCPHAVLMTTYQP